METPLIPYENQLIGAFLYAAGYAKGQRAVGDSASAPMPVNLLQQTPLDKSFNDLVIGRDRCFVLEFKRSLDKVAGEKSKWAPEQLAYFKSDRALQAYSMCGHLLVYGKPVAECIDLRVCFYLDALDLTPEPKLDRCSAQRLIERLHHIGPAKKLDFGLPPKQLLAYLEALRALRRSQKGSGGRSPKESAWVGVAKDEGGFTYRTAASLGELLGVEPSPEPRLEHDYDTPSPG